MKVDIDTKTFVRFWLVILGFVAAAYLIYSAHVALIIIGVSLFLALALNVPVSKIANRLPGKNRIGAAALSYVAVVAVLGAVVFLVVPPMVQQTAKFMQTIPGVVDSASTQWTVVNDLIDRYELRDEVNNALQSIKDNASSWATNLGQGVVAGVGSVVNFITASILVLVLTFLMLIEGPAWIRRLWNLYDNSAIMTRHKAVVDRMYQVVTGYVTGQLTVSAIGAAAAGLAVFTLSLIFTDLPTNLAIPTAAITFVLSLIPMFGATIGGIIITALLAFNNIPAAIIYAIFFVVYQQIENNMISPHIQSKRLDLSALTILIAVTIGIYMFGIIGGIIAIPIAGCIRVLLDEFLKNAKARRSANTKKAAKA